jgi:hypothetical protein
MRRVILTFLGLLLLPTSAEAAVTYTFSALSGGYSQTGSFSVTFNDFFTTGAGGSFPFFSNVPLSSLNSCSVKTSGFAGVPAQQLTCGDQGFAPSNTGFAGNHRPYDVIGFGFYSPFSSDSSGAWGLSTFAYYFTDGAFSQPGHYESLVLGSTQAGTLDVALTAVPEISTWAMMVSGFGAVGFAMRRRKQKIAEKVAYVSRSRTA